MKRSVRLLATTGLGLLAASAGALWSPSDAQAKECRYGTQGKCKIVLVNSHLGNDYRVQMQNSAQAASRKEPFSTEWEFSILNTERSVEAQNAGLENLLASGVDGIVLLAMSDTSAVEVVRKACNQGVLVVTFDVTAKANACERRLEYDFRTWSTDAGKWIGKALGCKGNVIVDKGIAGVSIAEDMWKGNLAGIEESCGKNAVKVVGEYFGEFSPQKGSAALSGLLASKRDVQAVIGTVHDCPGAARLFAENGLAPPVLNCQGFNASVQHLLKPGSRAFVVQTSFAGSIYAMELMRRLLKEEDVPKTTIWAANYVASDPTTDIGKPIQRAEPGRNVYPDLPPGFGPFYNYPGALVQITRDEALGRKPSL